MNPIQQAAAAGEMDPALAQRRMGGANYLVAGVAAAALAISGGAVKEANATEQLPAGVEPVPTDQFVTNAIQKCTDIIGSDNPYHKMRINPHNDDPRKVRVSVYIKKQSISPWVGGNENNPVSLKKIACDEFVDVRQVVGLRQDSNTKGKYGFDSRPLGGKADRRLAEPEFAGESSNVLINGFTSRQEEERLVSKKTDKQTVTLVAPRSVGRQMRRSYRKAGISVGVETQVRPKKEFREMLADKAPVLLDQSRRFTYVQEPLDIRSNREKTRFSSSKFDITATS